VSASLVSVSANPLLLSAGASGAVFGVFGALLAIVLRQRAVLPRAFVTGLGRETLLVIGINVVYTFSAKGVDVAGHFGGLGAGLLYGLLLASPAALDPRSAGAARRAGALVTLLAAGAAVGAGVFLAGGEGRATQDALDAVHQAEKAAVEAYNAAGRRAKAGEIDDKGFGQAVERDGVPHLERALQKIREVRGRRGIVEDRRAKMEEYLVARLSAWKALAAALRAGDPSRIEAAIRQNREAGGLLDKLNEGAKRRPK
jgi:hypothetical protein